MPGDPVSESLQQSADVANIAAAELRQELVRRREEAGFSQAQLSEVVRFSREHVSMAERKGLPSANLVAAIDNALGAAGSLIRAREEAQAKRIRGRSHHGTSSDLVLASSSFRAVTDENSASRDLADVITRAADAAWNFRGIEMTSSDFVESIYQDVKDLAWSYPLRAPGSILPSLTKSHALLLELLSKPQRPRQAADLYFLAGVTGGMLAKASHDHGDSLAALSLSRTALMCGEHAGHPRLQAWISGIQSLISYWAGNPGESISYAERGSLNAKTSSNSSLPLLACSEARAWARLGNYEKAHEKIQLAEKLRATVRVDDLDSLGGIAEFSHARQCYFVADALTWLPEDPAAERYARDAVDAYSDSSAPFWSFSDAAGSQAALATAQLHNSGEDAAANTLAPVLELPVNLRINGITHSVRRVQAAIARRPSIGKTGTSLRDRIDAYCTSSVRELNQ